MNVFHFPFLSTSPQIYESKADTVLLSDLSGISHALSSLERQAVSTGTC